MNLDMGDWSQEMAEAADILWKWGYTAEQQSSRSRALSGQTSSGTSGFSRQPKTSQSWPCSKQAAVSPHTTTAEAEQNWSAWGHT